MPGRQIATSIRWVGDIDGHLQLIDQKQLPGHLEYLDCRSPDVVWEAIKQLQVRGAPAIGIAAAYGICLASQAFECVDADKRCGELDAAVNYFASSRPTAVNLFWALDRMRNRAVQLPPETENDAFRRELLDEARQIHDQDRDVCHAIGRHGADLLKDGSGVLTHCNAGALATSEYGTALSAIFTAQDQGKLIHVYAGETRPLLQGARLTTWELMQRGVRVTLICDSMAAQVMKEGRIQAVIVGADRIAANGDTANKIGTYGVALHARMHDIPFYVAAPVSTFDLALKSGTDIPIEQRAAEEVTSAFGRRTAPEGVEVYNPAFDVTPAKYIDAIVTELGIVRPVNETSIRQLLTTTDESLLKDR